MKATVFLVDDDAAVLRGLEKIVEGEGFDVKTFETAELLLQSCGPQSAGCVVLDMRMPAMDGLQAQAELKRQGIHMPVIFLTGHGDVPMSVRAMKAGAYDFLEKPVAADTLLARVRGALKLDEYRWLRQSERDAAQVRLSLLTSREEGVLALLLSGRTNKEVARQLGLSPRTVEIHRKNILAKTGTSNLIELGQLYYIADSI